MTLAVALMVWPALIIQPAMVRAVELQAIFPAGAEVGTTTGVAFHGVNSVVTALCHHPGIQFAKSDEGDFHVTIAGDVPTGAYDVQVTTKDGISSCRTFFVTGRHHIIEQSPEETTTDIQQIPLGCCVSGRIAKGDTDLFRFTAERGQCVVLECWAERIDSSLRGVLEVRGPNGQLLAASPGFFGIDPAIPFTVPEDGEYIVRLHDLVFAGGPESFYRLDVHTDPRVVFALPPVVQRNAATSVTLFGWNLHTEDASQKENASSALEQAEVEVIHADATALHVTRRTSQQLATPTFSYHWQPCDTPISLGLAEFPVAVAVGNDAPEEAFPIDVPSVSSGQLTGSHQRDWYTFVARRGEVFYFEATGQRHGSPVDLDISVHPVNPGSGEPGAAVARFQDAPPTTPDMRFPLTHLDPSGRWVAPRDGQVLVAVRNLTGGIKDDQRRVYSLSVRREEPAVSLVVFPRGSQPTGVTVQRGGRVAVDVKAVRRRGMNRSIRISARNLPAGLSIEDVWLGPEVDTAPLVITASDDCPDLVGTIDLVATSATTGELEQTWPVQYGTMVRGGVPGGLGRMVQPLRVMVAGQAPARLFADGHERLNHHLYGKLKVRHSPGGILDVGVKVEGIESSQLAEVRLSAVGLPEAIDSQIAMLPPGSDRGHISFYLPTTLPVGTYTIAIQGQITMNNSKNVVTVISNPVTLTLEPAAFRLQIDPAAPRKIGRGQIVKIPYTARRVNGFIGKIHTELATPDAVTEIGRLRARGVTFVGQTENGTIQIIANEDADLGAIPFLRLYAVGVVEDQPVYHGCSFLDLEIVE